MLLEAIHYATSSETSTKDLERVIDVIKEEHLATIPTVIEQNTDHEKMLFKRLRHDLEEDCEHLRGFLKATWTIGEMSARTQDRVSGRWRAIGLSDCGYSFGKTSMPLFQHIDLALHLTNLLIIAIRARLRK